MTHGRSPSLPGSPVGGGQAGPGARQLPLAHGHGSTRGRGRDGQPGPVVPLSPGGREYRRPDKRPLGLIEPMFREGVWEVCFLPRQGLSAHDYFIRVKYNSCYTVVDLRLNR